MGHIRYGERVDAFADQGLTYGQDERGSFIVSTDADGNRYNSYARCRFADGALAGGGSIRDLPDALADEEGIKRARLNILPLRSVYASSNTRSSG